MNIEECYQIGLKLLSPSKKSLEHGLELHRSSIVCDTYGFCPANPVDPEKITAAAENLDSQMELTDLKSEMKTLRHLESEALRKEYSEIWKSSGVTCLFQNAGEEGQSVKKMIKRLSNFTHLTDRMPDFLTRAVHPDDIINAKEKGLSCLYFSSNGVPLREDWDDVESELMYIGIMFKLGFRMMHLTYNRRNMIGDGCGESFDAGLSDFGKAAVSEMNRVGVIADVAHSSEKTCLDTAAVSDKPVVASHAAAYALNGNYRCKSDKVIKAIADTGGYTGVCVIPPFLGMGGDINAFLDHICHMVKVAGADHVTIGTDCFSTSLEGSREANSKVSHLYKSRKNVGHLWPDFNQQNNFVEGHKESISWTNWPLFTVGLVERGLGDEDIQKIIGGNMLRVCRDVLPY
ncbi:MAG: dipeptidase [Planctomycetota bacterium]|jgi:membrane dipeptidase